MNRKRKEEEGIKALEQAADEYVKAIERKGVLKIIAEFNAMRRFENKATGARHSGTEY
jgi:hypothetical protein